MNYYPHHIGDYAKDTAHLSMIEDGAYRRLIDLYYSTEAPLTSDMTKLYRLVRAFTKQDRKAVSDMLNEFFTLTDAGYTQRRCDAEILRMQAKSDKARASVEKRWTNERNTKTDTNVSTNEHTNVLPTQYEGNTPNSQEPIANNQEPKKEKTKATPQAAFVVPDWIPKPSWEGWLAMRKAKKAPNTEHALRLAVGELEKLKHGGEDPAAVLDRSTQRGWTGLFPSKDRNNGQMFASTIPPERL